MTTENTDDDINQQTKHEFLRTQVLKLAIKSPNVSDPSQVLMAATMYYNFILHGNEFVKDYLSIDENTIKDILDKAVNNVSQNHQKEEKDSIQEKLEKLFPDSVVIKVSK